MEGSLRDINNINQGEREESLRRDIPFLPKNGKGGRSSLRRVILLSSGRKGGLCAELSLFLPKRRYTLRYREVYPVIYPGMGEVHHPGYIPGYERGTPPWVYASLCIWRGTPPWVYAPLCTSGYTHHAPRCLPVRYTCSVLAAVRVVGVLGSRRE